MTAPRRTADEQYQLIMECRNSGLSDYQWCQEHDIKPGTFYNWVKRLRKKACYDIPPAAGREEYKPSLKQDVVKLEVLPETSGTVLMESQTHEPVPVKFVPSMEINTGMISIKISNDIDPILLAQLLRSMTGNLC